MTNRNQALPYPRLCLRRYIARLLGRALLPILFRIQIFGKANFPAHGPLIVVGNHTAIMEVVLMVIFTPWQVEILGSADVPHERVTEIASRFYGYIGYRRGHLDRYALRQAQSVLDQKGILGIFPEGGIWQTTERRVQPGVAWLSEKCKAPVLPIYFGGVRGALGAALQLKRPRLTMHIGTPIPPLQIPPGASVREEYSNYAWMVMQRVDALGPERGAREAPKILDERFLLEIEVSDPSGVQIEIPGEIAVKHPEALAKLLHYPSILKIFHVNLKMPVSALMTLSSYPAERDILTGCRSILKYLAYENPYLLTYRFGPKEGELMRLGVSELEALALWAVETRNRLRISPIRKYIDIELGREVVQTEQGRFQNWM